MKTISFNPDGSQLREPTLQELHESLERLNQNLTSFAKGQKQFEEMKEKAFSWDRIDGATKESEERDAVDADNHDCGMDKGGEGSCDNSIHEETLCGNPHNNGNNEPENCNECMAFKLGI